MQLSLSKEAIFNKNTSKKVVHTSCMLFNDSSLYIKKIYIYIYI